jgi:2-(1,2-epoxy-1,2-dihydrophenyl)acetyl-CoA isomerase
MRETFENIICREQDGILTITLNRPEVLNALCLKMFDELSMVFHEAARDETIKVIIITGAGRAFCAGGDVKNDVSKLSTMGPFELRNYIHTNVIKKIVEMEKPVIAAINGIATGGGFDIALACDIRFASEKARFSEIFVKMGIIPDLGGVYFLPRLIGLSKAKLLAFTGDIIDSREAERIGLVDKVFPENQLMAAVEQLARQLAKGPSKTIAMIKVAMNRSLSMDLNSSLDYTTNLQCLLVQTEDHKEAFKAFLEKRKPIFKGR